MRTDKDSSDSASKEWERHINLLLLNDADNSSYRVAAHCKELRESIVNHMEQGLVDHTGPLWKVLDKTPKDYTSERSEEYEVKE